MVLRHMNRNGRELFITAVCIFLFMLLLESLAFRFMGDDYIYSFVWEGHSMYVPLSEDARRIQGISDIIYSGCSYYMLYDLGRKSDCPDAGHVLSLGRKALV